jgi:hypothetical protein
MMALLVKHWKFALIGASALALAVGFLYVRSLRAENVRLAEAAEVQRVTISRLSDDLEANRRALVLRQAESEQLARERQESVKALEAIYERDKDACDWSVGVIPDSVYVGLCQ